MECTITRLVTGPDGVDRRVRLLADDRPAGRLPGEGDRARDRRHRQGLRGHLELVGVQRRRPGARVRGRRRADRHGVRPVPPDRDGLAARRPRACSSPRRSAARAGSCATRTASGSCGSTCPRTAAPSTPPPTRRPPAGSPPCPRVARPTPAGPPELSTRDNVARAIYTEVKEGRGSPHGGVFLDISYLPAEHVRRKLPSMYEQFKELADVDITTGPMEVGPTTHYAMGGIRVDAETGATTVPGLFAAGEVAGGMHGANRLGGNSLSDLLVFGARTGDAAAAHAAGAPPPSRTSTRSRSRPRSPPLAAPLERPDGEDPVRDPARPAGDDAAPRRHLPGRGRPRRGDRQLAELRRALAGRPGDRRPGLQPGLEPRLRARQPPDRLRGDRRAAPASAPRAAAPTAGSTIRPPTTRTGASVNSVVVARSPDGTMAVTTTPSPR